MAYNLRPRRIRDVLLENEESEEEFIEQQDADITPSEDSSTADETDAEDDIEMEDVSLSDRLNQSRARGRPATKLRGKNGFFGKQLSLLVDQV